MFLLCSEILAWIRQTIETEEGAAHVKMTAGEACASAYSAASDMTFSTLSIFILAMLLYAEAQKHAQAEIDSVIGSNLARLPGDPEMPQPRSGISNH
ncbi:hypothetical protein HD554DRAFT_360578 [Boletus coccyginus]|nr:hypothetical protein HD554DRAFT_360578 [Boletus coccyginus]